jgi:hypothetical protein
MPINPQSAILSEIRGKLGPWVYARNRGGPIRRPYQEHRTMTSPAQTAQQNLMAAVRPRWSSTLTETQRRAWREFTEQFTRHDQLAQAYAPSGIARFCGCNIISYKYAGTFLDDPPVDLHCHQPTAVEILTATAAPQTLTIRMYGTLDANESWVLGSTPAKSVGFHNLANLWRPLAFGTNALPFTYNAIAAYTATFGPLLAAKRIGVRFQIANAATGTISQPQTTQAIVA